MHVQHITLHYTTLHYTMLHGFGGRTLPLRFAQFRYASSTTSLSTLTLRDVAVIKNGKQHNNPFPLTKPKTTRAQKNKTTNTNKNQKIPKITKKNNISVLFQNRTRIIHKWRSAEIMTFWCFGLFCFVFLCFLVFLVSETIVSIVSTL